MHSHTDSGAGPGPVAWKPHQLAALDALVDSLASNRATIYALQALEATMLGAVMGLAEERMPPGSSTAELPVREVAAEVAAALRVSDRTVQRQLADAVVLTTRFPGTHRALSEGRISRLHADVITDAGYRISDDAARDAYEAAVLDHAVCESANRLRPIAKLLAERVPSEPIEQRHARAKSDRSVILRDLPDGMAELLATLPAALAHGIHDRLSQYARAMKEDARSATAQVDGSENRETTETLVPDLRTMDQLRADVLADLLLTAKPIGLGPDHLTEPIHARVMIQVPVLMLLGVTNASPPQLTGHGPIDPDTARRLTANAPGWDRVLTHPVSGAVLAVDRYRPTEELRRFLRVRDQHCRFPGCRLGAHLCDADHLHDAAHGGPTSHENLAHECRRHHVLKHGTAWTVRHVGGGILHWRSPTGRVYPDRPVSSVTFRPDSHAPPF